MIKCTAEKQLHHTEHIKGEKKRSPIPVFAVGQHSYSHVQKPTVEQLAAENEKLAAAGGGGVRMEVDPNEKDDNEGGDGDNA